MWGSFWGPFGSVLCVLLALILASFGNHLYVIFGSIAGYSFVFFRGSKEKGGGASITGGEGAGGIGVLRCLKLAKYLTRLGWEPVIFTSSSDAYQFLDDKNNADIPEGLEVIRIRAFNPIAAFKLFSGRKKDTPLIDIKKVGIIGAGTMGGGIAMNFLNAGIPVTIIEAKQENLERGVGVIRKNYENTAKKGRLTQDDVEKRMALLTPSMEMEALADCDMIIEAVFELMEIKKEVFTKLDKIAKPGAILATNTSSLSVTEIAATAKQQEATVNEQAATTNGSHQNIRWAVELREDF